MLIRKVSAYLTGLTLKIKNMSNLISHIQSKLSISLIAFFSAIFMSAGRYERNPQDCEMVSVQIKKKRDEAIERYSDSQQSEKK